MSKAKQIFNALADSPISASQQLLDYAKNADLQYQLDEMKAGKLLLAKALGITDEPRWKWIILEVENMKAQLTNLEAFKLKVEQAEVVGSVMINRIQHPIIVLPEIL